mgnify:CR=1 FL=1
MDQIPEGKRTEHWEIQFAEIDSENLITNNYQRSTHIDQSNYYINQF